MSKALFWQYFIQKSSGFSLIELLVAISIIMVVAGGTVTSYDRYNKRQVLKQAAQTLKNNLRLAQNNAITGLKPISGCTNLSGYQVSFTQVTVTTPAYYAIQAVCTEGLVGNINSVNLPKGVGFWPLPTSLTFGVLTQGAQDATITVYNSAWTGQSFNYDDIVVSASGDINDLGLR